jgi:hypothetical protein
MSKRFANWTRIGRRSAEQGCRQDDFILRRRRFRASVPRLHRYRQEQKAVEHPTSLPICTDFSPTRLQGSKSGDLVDVGIFELKSQRRPGKCHQSDRQIRCRMEDATGQAMEGHYRHVQHR